MFCISGSIACFKAADVVSKLVQQGFEVQVVMSAGAQKFIGKSTFEGLTGHAVLDDLFESGKAMEHIRLARWADLFVLCPASAHKISELAQGAASDLITSLFLAKRPFLPALIFPAMNSEMWANPLVQKNCEILKSQAQLKVIEPSAGALACGETGKGRLLESAEILEIIKNTLNSSPEQKPKILITGGGTSEKIDSVRSITNSSSGQTASYLADRLSECGFNIDILLSSAARFEPTKIDVTQRFTTHDDLSSELKSLLTQNSYFAVFHFAAVSDFRPDAKVGKVSSRQDTLLLELKRTPKIIRNLREWSINKKSLLFGAKLTAGIDFESRIEISKNLLSENDLDFVMNNDVTEISSTTHHGLLLGKDSSVNTFTTKSEMCHQILQAMEGVQ